MEKEFIRKDYQGARQYFEMLKQRYPEAGWQGYYWMSDSMKQVFCSSIDDYLPSLDQLNPFITEGWLYHKGQKVSVSIRMVDGSYRIGEYVLTGQEETIKDTYLPNSVTKEFEKMNFFTVWEPVADELCAGFDVLKPVARVFTGFHNE